MKSLFLSLAFSLFSSSLVGQTPIGVNRLSDLVFPVQVQGFAVTSVVAPNTPGAALFSISGQPNQTLKCKTVSNNVNMMTSGGSSNPYKIRVNAFLINGCTQIGPTGFLNNVSIGATAQITVSNVEGDYNATNTLRVVYH